jgi:hypothetical protein
MKTSKTAKRCKLIHSMLSPFRFIAMVSLFLTPFFSYPSWCIQRKLVSEECEPERYPNSGIPKLS